MSRSTLQPTKPRARAAVPATAAPPRGSARAVNAQVVSPTPATHCVGIVTACDAEALTVTSGALVAKGRRAASCLLVPAPGDSVACLLVAPDELWVLAVLQREDGVPYVLGGIGPMRIEAQALGLECDRFSLNTRRADIASDETQFVGREMRLVGAVMKLTGSLLSTVFDRVTHFSKNHLRTTQGVDRVQATHLEQEAQQLLRLSGEHALINGEKLVKARGGQIHFG
jgi:hypothetical protein